MKNALLVIMTIIVIGSIVFFTSCNQTKVSDLEKQLALKTEQVEQLENQLEHLQGTNSSLLDRLSDLSVLSKQGADNISKSLENIAQQYSFIEDLTDKVQTKDSINQMLVSNIKRSLNDFDDEDIQVEVKGSIVHVSISDKLLYDSGEDEVSDEATDIMNKLASIINDHEELDVMIEGHTDDVPMEGSCLKDNWDLSVKRATSIVRLLQEDYYVNPERLTAAGRGQYVPKFENDSAEGRSLNRRTEIIMTPQLDQFFALLESPVLQN